MDDAVRAANGTGNGPDPDATSPFGSFDPGGASGQGAAARAEDPDGTRIGVPGAPIVDTNATLLKTPPPVDVDPDATRLGMPMSPPIDPDATRLGAPPPEFDPNATRLYTPPAAAARNRTEYLGTSGGVRTFGDAATDLVGKPLGTRYTVQRLLGAGGMGAVYEAWDKELGVVVALKTVRPEIAADPESARLLERRFKQELLLARQVTHKNIVRVHDMGEVDGIKYITMPYLEGEDLSTILTRDGKLPVERVMPIARQVASGLVAAHEAGVVHRDLKPANIMIVESGDALIMDFGVASSTGAPKPVSAPGPDGKVRPTITADQTQMGSVVGTVAYMAPEQARAQPVDQRADIYAFGLILYDLLLGRMRATRTDSVVSELNLRMKEAPPPPRSVDGAIPEGLEKIIMRCVQPAATDRYPTTKDLLADLEALDDHGNPLPIIRRLTWRMGAAAAAVVVMLLGLTWWFARGPAPEVQHEPVSVLIADFKNTTGDQTFERTLEPMLKLALEGAGFINAYDRTSVRLLGVKTPKSLDEQAALEMAVKQGVNIVLTGSIEPRGSGYTVGMKAAQVVTGNVVATETQRASSKEQVLSTATKLASKMREALGDDTSGSGRRFAMETLSATSLDAVHEYARGLDALSLSKFDEALQSFSKAVALDANFGSAYAGMAIASRNLDRHQDTAKYLDEALKHTDGMTEREVYRTRGFYYLISDDNQSCVKEYSDLIAKYSADVAARNNRAVCLTQLRRMDEAVADMREVVKIFPQRVLYRQNLALYAAYSGDVDTATQEIDALEDPGLFGLLARAYTQLLQEKPAEALTTYGSIEKLDEQAASYAAAGRGDVATYEGRYADASRILTEGVAADVAAREPDRAANKLLSLAYAELQRQRRPAAIAAANKALENSRSMKTRVLAARIYAEAGEAAKAKALADQLSAEVPATPRAYGKMIDGLLSLEAGDAPKAIQSLSDGTGLLDAWIAHYDLGRAYLKAGLFLQADSEFDRCIKRRGEALSLFLDEEPSFGYLPLVYYYQGRAQEGLKSTAKAADAFKAYLRIRGTSTEDALVTDARKRAGL